MERISVVHVWQADGGAALRRIGAIGFEIPFLLGFEEPTSFARAFRGWEVTTPLRYREGDSAREAK